MISILPNDVSAALEKQSPCRRSQIEQLALYYNQYLPYPPVLVACGLRSTGKLATIIDFFNATHICHAVVKSRECLSQRHLLTKIFAECIRSLGQEGDIEQYDRVDSLNALSVGLQKLFICSGSKFVLVIDGIDRQKGASSTLTPALATLGDFVPGLSIIFVLSSYRPLQLHRSGVPHVHFTPYSREEAIHIALQHLPALQPESLPEEFQVVADSTLCKIYLSFVGVVYDTLAIHTSSAIISIFRQNCETLWPRFIWPMLLGDSTDPNSGRNSTTSWNFARLLAKNRPLFQVQGERVLAGRILSRSNEPWTFDELIAHYHQMKRDGLSLTDATRALTLDFGSTTASSISVLEKGNTTSILEHLSSTPLLKFFPTLLLVSSYLASHGPPKHDIILFSRLSSSSSHKKRYLSSALNKNRTPKIQRVRKTPLKSPSRNIEANRTESDLQQTPSKTRNLESIQNTPLAKEKTHRSTRLQFEKTSSIPRPFTLERLIAVLRAVHPDGLSRTRGVADKVYTEMVELERLRLVVRLGTSANAGTSATASASGGAVSSNAFCAGGSGGVSGVGASDGSGGKGTDDGILEEKWRVNVARDLVIDIGRRWGISLEGWEID